MWFVYVSQVQLQNRIFFLLQKQFLEEKKECMFWSIGYFYCWTPFGQLFRPFYTIGLLKQLIYKFSSKNFQDCLFFNYLQRKGNGRNVTPRREEIELDELDEVHERVRELHDEFEVQKKG